MKVDFGKITNIYFLGIGGIGMSALARYFVATGKQVAGYDLTASAITSDLVALGIAIHYDDAIESIPQSFQDKWNTLIIRTPAVPVDHSELNFFIREGFQIVKRSEVLGQIFNGNSGIAIAGTHGKTSVSSMLAFILDQSPVGCSAFLGGILKNTGSNLILNRSSDFIVAEADEFDRSFLQLYPKLALVTWVDADHLDIYKNSSEIEDAFQTFAKQIRDGGTLVVKKGILLKPSEGVRVLSYALDDPQADFYAKDIRIENNKYTFTISTPEGTIEAIHLKIPGITNVENAVAAASMAYLSGVSFETIREAFSNFSGVKRRFDIQFENSQTIYIDDYAHHPRELDAVINSVRKIYSGKKISGIFQPHLYSRTRDFADDFAKSLSQLDELILLDIYPAREMPIEGVSSAMIFDKVDLEAKIKIAKEGLMSVLKERSFELLLTMGAGDIDRFITPIKDMLTNR